MCSALLLVYIMCIYTLHDCVCVVQYIMYKNDIHNSYQ